MPYFEENYDYIPGFEGNTGSPPTNIPEFFTSPRPKPKKKARSGILPNLGMGPGTVVDEPPQRPQIPPSNPQSGPDYIYREPANLPLSSVPGGSNIPPAYNPNVPGPLSGVAGPDLALSPGTSPKLSPPQPNLAPSPQYYSEPDDPFSLEPSLPEQPDYENNPSLAPPNSVWNAKTQTWDTTAPTEEGYDPTWGGYVDPNNADDPNRPWLDEVHEHQGWEPLPSVSPPIETTPPIVAAPPTVTPPPPITEEPTKPPGVVTNNVPPDLGKTRPGDDPHKVLGTPAVIPEDPYLEPNSEEFEKPRDLANPTSTLDEKGVQTNISTGYRKVLPATRDAGERERNAIYGSIIDLLRNPNTESTERLRSLYEGIPEFTENLVGDWRNDDYGLLADLRSRFSTHGEGVGDDVKNAISERGAGALRSLHDDISRNRSAAFARNPYAVDSGIGFDTLGKTGQAFADNSRAASLEGERLDQRAKEFGLSGISDIDFARFGAAERGDERYRGLGTATEFGIRDRDDSRDRFGISKLLDTYGGVHGPSAMEAGYDLSRRGQDLTQTLNNQDIISRDYFGDKGMNFEREQSALDRLLAERGQDKGVETAKGSRPPWWSHLIPF